MWAVFTKYPLGELIHWYIDHQRSHLWSLISPLLRWALHYNASLKVSWEVFLELHISLSWVGIKQFSEVSGHGTRLWWVKLVFRDPNSPASLRDRFTITKNTKIFFLYVALKFLFILLFILDLHILDFEMRTKHLFFFFFFSILQMFVLKSFTFS